MWLLPLHDVLFFHHIASELDKLVGHCRSSEALLTKQAAALVRGVDLAAGLRNRLHLLLDLHAAASVPVTQEALTLFVNSICLVKVSHPSLLHLTSDRLTLPTNMSTGSLQTMSTLMRIVDCTNIQKKLCTASLRCRWLLANDCISKTCIMHNARRLFTLGLQIALLLQDC